MVTIFLGVVAGLILATLLDIHSVPIWSLVGLAASVIFISFENPLAIKLKPGAILAATMLFGVVLYGASYFDPSATQVKPGKINQVKGQVITYPKVAGNRIEFTMEPEGYEGNIKVFLAGKSGNLIDYGDRITVSGNFQRPGRFQGFNYREYLRKKGIGLVTYRAKVKSSENESANPLLEFGWGVRQILTNRINRFLPSKGQFLIALLFGNRAILEEKVNDAFTGTGLAHLLAASGLHLGIIVGLIWWMLSLLGLEKGAIYLISLPVLFLYLLTVGFKLPLLRASMIYVFGGAHFYLESNGLILSEWYDRYQALATAALLLVLLNPESITTAGFQLSFGATFSIALFIDPIKKVLTLKPDYLSEVLAASIAAQFGVAPVLAVHFGQVYPWAPLANLFAVPTVTLALYSGLILLGLGGLKFIGLAITKITALIIFLTESLVRSISRLPFAAIETPSVTPLALLSYFVLLFWFRSKLTGSAPFPKISDRYLSS